MRRERDICREGEVIREKENRKSVIRDRERKKGKRKIDLNTLKHMKRE
jgi:hypothetical protein